MALTIREEIRYGVLSLARDSQEWVLLCANDLDCTVAQ